MRGCNTNLTVIHLFNNFDKFIQNDIIFFMNEKDLRGRLDDLSQEETDSLRAEAILSRKKLITSVAEAIDTLFRADIETLEKTRRKDGVLYVKIHQAEEGDTNDTEGEQPHISVNMVMDDTSEEIVFRIPVSKEFMKAYEEAGADPPIEAYEIFKQTPITAIYAQYSELGPFGKEEVFKRITALGSVEYSEYSNSSDPDRPKRGSSRFNKFMKRLRLFETGQAGVEDITSFSPKDIDSDKSYIDNLRKAAANMRPRPRVYLGESART